MDGEASSARTDMPDRDNTDQRDQALANLRAALAILDEIGEDTVAAHVSMAIDLLSPKRNGKG
jgi:hypothetical protein